MAVELTTTWPKADKIAFGNLINDLAADAGVSIGVAVKSAAGFVATSAAFSTRKAPRIRAIRKNKPGMSRTFHPDRYPFYIVRFVRGVEKPWFTNAQTRANVAMHPKAQIRRRGLAKSVWQVVAQKVGKPANASKGSLASRFAKVTDKSKNKLEDHSVTIESRVNYAELAFKQKGKYTVDSISQRAVFYLAEGIRKGTSKRWAQRMQAEG